MLLRLDVENLLLIESASLEFGSGLNVLTGETGAGKTLVAAAIGLIAGERSRSGLVRPGAASALVSGTFATDDGAEIVLERQAWPDGRSRARVDGRPATVGELRELAGSLLGFHGQHEHRRLVLAGFQLATLDSYCGETQRELLASYGRLHEEAKELEARLDELSGGGGAAEREVDLLGWELAEIERLAPTPEERERLVRERDLLRDAEATREALAEAAQALLGTDDHPGAVGAAASAAERLARFVPASGEPDRLVDRLASAAAELEDVAHEIRERLDSLESPSMSLDEIETRLESYASLERKHGGSIESVLAHAESCRSRLADLGDVGAAIERLEDELAGVVDRRDGFAAELGEARRRAAPVLAEGVSGELSELGLDGARFEIRVTALDSPGSSGSDRVEFMFAPNAGLDPVPLGEGASGGEVSRVLLSLLAVANSGSGEGGRLLVFDEVDAGIGGRTAVAVGDRLARIADRSQILCITHLAPVAARAGTHFRIEKESIAGSTATSVTRLDGDLLVDELVRMLGADGTDPAALEHARRLLSGATPEIAD